MKRFLISLLFILACFLLCNGQDVIDVSVQGISDGQRDSQQQDRDESILDAKLKAIERAGVSIEAVTVMENFQLKSDWVESRAEATILPGFQIADVGYGEDGLYHVVLIGRVRSQEEHIEHGELRYAKDLLERNKKSEAKVIIQEIMNNRDNEALCEEAQYLYIKWGLSSNQYEETCKFKAYYPSSKYFPILISKFISDLDDSLQSYNSKLHSLENRISTLKKDHERTIGSFSISTSSIIQQVELRGSYDPKANYNIKGPSFTYIDASGKTREVNIKYKLRVKGSKRKLRNPDKWSRFIVTICLTDIFGEEKTARLEMFPDAKYIYKLYCYGFSSFYLLYNGERLRKSYSIDWGATYKIILSYKLPIAKLERTKSKCLKNKSTVLSEIDKYNSLL